MSMLKRVLHPEVRVLDAKTGLVEYVASDETVDSYREVIRASGWRFSRFARNAPFVDSHNYDCLDKLVGRVVDFKVAGSRLVETVQWAIDVAENKLAQLGWRMTEAGYLKAVSVGFFPLRVLTPWDNGADGLTAWQQQLAELGLSQQDGPRAIYVEQEQVELSACIIGANANALARSYKAGLMDDEMLEMISLECAKRDTASAADKAAGDALARQRQREACFLSRLETALKAV